MDNFKTCFSVFKSKFNELRLVVALKDENKAAKDANEQQRSGLVKSESRNKRMT